MTYMSARDGRKKERQTRTDRNTNRTLTRNTITNEENDKQKVEITKLII